MGYLAEAELRWQRVNKVTAPSVQISWGELIDKITILEIKEQRLLSKQSITNVRNELAALMSVARHALAEQKDVAALRKQLKSVNERRSGTLRTGSVPRRQHNHSTRNSFNWRDRCI